MEILQKMDLKATVRPKKKERIKLPFLVWVIAVSTGIACVGGTSFLGYNIAGYAWAIPLFLSAIIFLRNQGKVWFPVWIWLPWACLVVIYVIFAGAENAFQRSVMLLCPLFIGMTVSKCRIGENELSAFRRLYRYMAASLCVVVVLKTGLLVTGALPEASDLAAPVMTGALLCTLFATNYMFGQKTDLAWWGALAVIPVIAITRMGMIATGLSLPLTFAPMKIFRRVVLTALIISVGYGLFFTERVQKKNFYSGSGTFQDISRDNPNFATSGRNFIWENMQVQIDKQPWFGHGANSSEPFVARITGGLTHPHNDWLRLFFDYGYFGAVIFGLTMALQVLHLIKKGKQSSGEIRILFFAGASSFIAFILFMFTDNIILYAAFFGNFQFTLLGLAYAAHATPMKEDRQALSPKRPFYKRISW
jgi:O-antigen ligase